MATEISTSIMPADLFMAAVQGNSVFFVRHLGLPAEDQNHIEVTVDVEQIQEEIKVVLYNLESATSSGETILHILVANRHNELAKKVFQKNVSLLKARNNKLQTPLHYAAKVGNAEIIHSLMKLAPAGVVKDALKETDDNNDTALHLAVKHRHYNVVESMLEVDSSLACTQFSDGTFPIHIAARIGNKKIVNHLLRKNLDSAELQDQLGRNFFHIAAEENKFEVFSGLFKEDDVMLVRMINAEDYDGNTPLHIAAMKGNMEIMRFIWENLATYSSRKRKNLGLTPFDLSEIQLKHTSQWIPRNVEWYIVKSGREFSEKWFDQIMRLSLIEHKWEKMQLVGLGSVLIATVAFAAAFTVPGGYNAENGAPVLGRRFMFRAFILANALAFMQAFLSVGSLVWCGARDSLDDADLKCAAILFVSAASCMVLSFGTGSYVMLAPVRMPTAVIILALALLFGHPITVFFVYVGTKEFVKILSAISDLKSILLFTAWSLFPLVFMFFLAFLK